jgi:thiol-disulfide isomerase/thioredoxin
MMIMNEDVILRLALVFFLIAAGAGLFWLVNRVILLRTSLINPTSASWPSGLPGKGKPIILYFSTPTCAPCRTIQLPAIERIQDQHGEALEVIEIDVSTQTDLAARWGIMSVPTTFIIDTEGNPRYVNHGVASVEKLASQVSELIK